MGKIIIEIPENIDMHIQTNSLSNAINELTNYINCTDQNLKEYSNLCKVFDQFQIEMTGFRAYPMKEKVR